jgi:predicted nucleotidyltransferase
MSTQYENLPADIKDFLKQLHEVAQDSTMYLFGSFAKGVARVDSDIDVLLVENIEKSKRFRRKVELRGPLWGKAPRSYDLLLTSPDEIERRKDDRWWIGYKAIHEGIKIYG